MKLINQRTSRQCSVDEKTNSDRRKLKILSHTDEFSMKVERIRTGDERWIREEVQNATFRK
jgi:hypothetical protein